MAHAFTTHLRKSHLNAALFADHTAVLQTLVLTAQALIILHRPENLGAEQTVAFRLKSTVVDGFRLFNFAVRPGTDLFGRCKTDLDRIEMIILVKLLKQIDKRIHQFCP